MVENHPDTNVGNIEYISKADAVKAIGEEYVPRTDFERGMVSQMSCDKDKIRRLSPADVVEVKHGEWISECEPHYECSKCHHWFHLYQYMNYCPNCGAKMDREE